MPFKPYTPFEPVRPKPAPQVPQPCHGHTPPFTIDINEEPGFLTILDDNDVLLLVKDEPAKDNDVLFLQDDESGDVLVQDRPEVIPHDPVLLTDNQQTSLIDAGPVFQGPPGKTGPEGANLFDTWRMETGNTDATFSDFMNYLRQGLGSGASGGTFVFTQYQPAAVWKIQHNLNKYPQIMCEDSAGESFDADYNYVNENYIEITIISPTAGRVFLN